MVVQDDGDHVRPLLVNLQPVVNWKAGHATLQDDFTAGAHGSDGCPPLTLSVGVKDGGSVLLAEGGFFGNGFRRARVVHLRVKPGDVGGCSDDERLNGESFKEGVEVAILYPVWGFPRVLLRGLTYGLYAKWCNV